MTDDIEPDLLAILGPLAIVFVYAFAGTVFLVFLSALPSSGTRRAKVMKKRQQKYKYVGWIRDDSKAWQGWTAVDGDDDWDKLAERLRARKTDADGGCLGMNYASCITEGENPEGSVDTEDDEESVPCADCNAMGAVDGTTCETCAGRGFVCWPD